MSCFIEVFLIYYNYPKTNPKYEWYERDQQSLLKYKRIKISIVILKELDGCPKQLSIRVNIQDILDSKVLAHLQFSLNDSVVLSKLFAASLLEVYTLFLDSFEV